ncbi:hypothetical protein KGQ20_42390, partial [Catenulispora sp. NF23]
MAHGHVHRSSPRRGARISVPITIVVALVLGASAGGAAWYSARHRHTSGAAASVSCASRPTTVSAVVAPDLASVLAPVLAPQPVPCVRVLMTAADSADMAQYLAGSGAAPAGVRGRPDVWI